MPDVEGGATEDMEVVIEVAGTGSAPRLPQRQPRPRAARCSGPNLAHCCACRDIEPLTVVKQLFKPSAAVSRAGESGLGLRPGAASCRHVGLQGSCCLQLPLALALNSQKKAAS